MGFYERELLPRLVDLVLSRPRFLELRAEAARGLEGRIVEVGFGSGANLPFLPPEVSHVWAVDPSLTGQKLAAERKAATRARVEHVSLDAEEIPLPTGGADHVLCTWTLCTIPDPERALQEIRRVLRPGGSLHFAEHGRSARPGVARWQERLTPLWSRVAGGCHLDRDVDGLIRGSGMRLERLEHPRVRGPSAFTNMSVGRAVKVVP